jgi:hypothetical protein
MYADDLIPKFSIITEYCGEVMRLSEAKDNDNDSIMDLVRCKDDERYE